MGKRENCSSRRCHLKRRTPFQGVITIARFNWPFYLGAVLVVIASAAGLFSSSDVGLKFGYVMALLCSGYFLVGSLGVSHLVYDRSELYRWSWLHGVLTGAKSRRGFFCHSGFDDASAGLRERFDDVHWDILDHYDEKRMTEPSIRRARAMFPPGPGTVASPYGAWPMRSELADVIIGFLAIHEFRTEKERTAWFCEAKRCLRNGGRIVLVEHARDLANFLAFGPGFFHFHSPSSWRRCWEAAGLRMGEQFRVTPFVRVFVLCP